MRFLVVDDDADVRLLVRVYLQRWGQDVVTVGDLTEATRICAEDRPDVLLLDVTMPEMDGASFLRSLRDAAIAPPHTYFVSAIPPDELGRLAAELDAGLVAKPFTGADLRAQLADVLGDAEGG